mmetsp:Transcript_80852/g.152826  ORF Transcript_80852/g.152826 Transcript_80852/m.152826 type:complete len:138 (+) Transcript_80852:70-483(+)
MPVSRKHLPFEASDVDVGIPLQADADRFFKGIGDVGPPSGFDASCSLIAANFPPDVNSVAVGCFFAWFAPVVHAERISKTIFGTDSNWCITFVDSSSAERVMSNQLYYPLAAQEEQIRRPIFMKRIVPEAYGAFCCR